MGTILGFVVLAGVVLMIAAGLFLSIRDTFGPLFGFKPASEQQPETTTKPAPRSQSAAGRSAAAGTTAATSPASSGIAGSTWLALGVAGLSLIAILPFPIGFYTLLRIVVCGSALFLVSILWERNRAISGWLIAIAVLFNPIFPIWLTKEIWAVLNAGTAVIFSIAAWHVQRLPAVDPSKPDAG